MSGRLAHTHIHTLNIQPTYQQMSPRDSHVSVGCYLLLQQQTLTVLHPVCHADGGYPSHHVRPSARREFLEMWGCSRPATTNRLRAGRRRGRRETDVENNFDGDCSVNWCRGRRPCHASRHESILTTANITMTTRHVRHSTTCLISQSPAVASCQYRSSVNGIWYHVYRLYDCHLSLGPDSQKILRQT